MYPWVALFLPCNMMQRKVTLAERTFQADPKCFINHNPHFFPNTLHQHLAIKEFQARMEKIHQQGSLLSITYVKSNFAILDTCTTLCCSFSWGRRTLSFVVKAIWVSYWRDTLIWLCIYLLCSETACESQARQCKITQSIIRKRGELDKKIKAVYVLAYLS